MSSTSNQNMQDASSQYNVDKSMCQSYVQNFEFLETKAKKKRLNRGTRYRIFAGQMIRQSRPWGPFLESPDNFSGPESYFMCAIFAFKTQRLLVLKAEQ